MTTILADKRREWAAPSLLFQLFCFLYDNSDVVLLRISSVWQHIFTQIFSYSSYIDITSKCNFSPLFFFWIRQRRWRVFDLFPHLKCDDYIDSHLFAHMFVCFTWHCFYSGFTYFFFQFFHLESKNISIFIKRFSR